MTAAPALVVFGACGGTTSPPNLQSDADVHPPRNDAAGGDARLDAPVHPDASCLVTIASPTIEDSPHVPIGTPVTYGSNPPSSGPHYPVWAAFQEYATPVDRRYYVHDLEHGAVVLLYNCDLLDAGAPDASPEGGDAGDAAAQDGGDAGAMTCDSLVAGLRAAMQSIPDDPLCDPEAGVRVRYVLTPDPLIPTPVAASAWGWTYTAACVDLPTLEAFAQGHYAQAPEDFCANGQASF